MEAEDDVDQIIRQFSTESDRRIAESLYTKEELRKFDEATVRLHKKDSPNFGPTGACPCSGVTVYLFKQRVHYCALCDTEYADSVGVPVIGKEKQE